MSEKLELNAVLAKIERSLNIWVKTRVFYAIKTECVFSKTNKMGSNHMLLRTKQNKTENKNKDAPRITHIIWSNKNIAHWKMTWYFDDENGDASGHPQALTLVPLEYFLGCHGHPQAWAFIHNSSHHIILLPIHLKTSFIQNSSQFSLATLVQSK